MAFDFYNCKPFVLMNGQLFYQYAGTYYSRDFKRTKRHVFKEDDSYGEESKLRRKSIFISYDRSTKLNIHEGVCRVEWRIRDERAMRLLEISDLLFTMDGFILAKGYRIKDITERYISPEMIQFNKNYIYQNFPNFARLVTV